MILYDIHTHHRKPETEGYEVRCILNTSPDDYASTEKNMENVWFSCGIHPWLSFNSESQFELLKDFAVQDKLIAIGEAGLDKLKGPDLGIQIEVFRKQIELAQKVKKPLIIHCVKAWDELIALYKEYRTDIPWIIHGYRGNVEQTTQLDKLGFKFSIGERFNAEALRYIPIDSLFCETDMSDVFVSKVYSLVCEILNCSTEQFAINISDNMRVLFKNMTK